MPENNVIDTDKLSDKFSQVFFRFFIPGLVFIMFVILLPYFFIDMAFDQTDSKLKELPGFSNEILQPTIFILLAIGVGIFLDLPRFYGLMNAIFFPRNEKSSWFSLKVSITKEFKIYVNVNKAKSKKYRKKVIDIAYHIHSLFIRTKYPEIDQKIENSRMYPDILSTSLISIAIGFSIMFLFLVFRETSSSSSGSENNLCIPGNYLPWMFVILLFLQIAIFVIPNFFSDELNKPKKILFGIVKWTIHIASIIWIIIAVFKIVKELLGDNSDLFLFISIVIGFITVFFGFKKVRSEFVKLNELTKSHVEQTYEKLSKPETGTEELNRFYKGMEKITLIEKLNKNEIQEEIECNEREVKNIEIAKNKDIAKIIDEVKEKRELIDKFEADIAKLKIKTENNENEVNEVTKKNEKVKAHIENKNNEMQKIEKDKKREMQKLQDKIEKLKDLITNYDYKVYENDLK